MTQGFLLSSGTKNCTHIILEHWNSLEKSLQMPVNYVSVNRSQQDVTGFLSVTLNQNKNTDAMMENAFAFKFSRLLQSSIAQNTILGNSTAIDCIN